MSDDTTPIAPVTSAHSFPDGGAWRIEISSVEGPAVMSAVLDEAARRSVLVHRISQVSGVMMLTDAPASVSRSTST